MSIKRCAAQVSVGSDAVPAFSGFSEFSRSDIRVARAARGLRAAKTGALGSSLARMGNCHSMCQSMDSPPPSGRISSPHTMNSAGSVQGSRRSVTRSVARGKP